MAGTRTCDRESQVQRPNHYTTEPPKQILVLCSQIRVDRTTQIQISCIVSERVRVNSD